MSPEKKKRGPRKKAVPITVLEAAPAPAPPAAAPAPTPAPAPAPVMSRMVYKPPVAGFKVEPTTICPNPDW